MNIKKYVAVTERDAVEMVKNDLGMEAVILNIKKIQPKGITRLFKKPSVEVLAAIDEQAQIQKSEPSLNKQDLESLEKKIDRLENLVSQGNLSLKDELLDSEFDTSTEEYKNEVVELLYNHFIANDINEEVALSLIRGIKSKDLDEVISTVYKRLVKLLDVPHVITHESVQKKIIFVGTTGVGKTTTIAKVAANLIIKEDKDVALITTDTYRIAAVDQLKTYAKILNVPIDVAYSNSDLKEALNRFKDKDVILIDTAGASQKNEDQFKDTMKLLDELRESEVYLVLNLTTKYTDMTEIIEKYSCFRNINLIFSKIDETNLIGNIINIKSQYSAKLSYVTTGQNVPEDIEIIDPQAIAKRLLGGDYT